MSNSELFLESHRQLLEAMKLINKPLFYVPRYSSIDLNSLEACSILLGDEPVGKGIEVIAPINKDVYKILITTFCKSHLRLK